LYLTTEVSYQELALLVGMNNPSLITKWVNDYRIAGPDALKPKRKGRRSKVTKPKDINSDNSKETNADTEYRKQLEEENLKLRIENAYLKELRRLRLEETPQNEKRESSAASEDTSN
jgi:transposase